MRTLISTLAGLIAAAALFAPQAQAVVLTYNFTGTVNTNWDPTWSGGVFNVGDWVSGSFTYDTGAADGNGSADNGVYFAGGISMSFQSGYTAADSNTIDQVLDDWFMALDSFTASNDGAVSGGAVAGLTPLNMLVGFVDPSMTAFSSDALPSPFPLLSAFTSRSGYVSFTGGEVNQYVYFTIQTLTPDEAPVPEPATLALMGAGLAGLGVLRKRTTR